MILFIAPNPHKVKKHEGFLQRVLAIDQLFDGYDKVYSEDLDEKKLAEALLAADLVYVHSIYNSEKIIGCYASMSQKIITDLHGVVPEEERYSDNQEGYLVMSEVEKEVFLYGKWFVAVTDSMQQHFNSKYPHSKKATWLKLPISGEYIEQDGLKKKQSNKVIYSGGGQSWQNVDLMVDVINKLDKFKFTILTHDKESFNKINPKALDGRVDIKSVKHDQVTSYYSEATLGFILREDTLVNNVACPTKMIEYLANGVIPIVLSEKIGDFKEMGYRYIDIKKFIKFTPDPVFLSEAQLDNRKVYELLMKDVLSGKKRLMNIVKKIVAHPSKSGLSVDAIVASFAIQQLRDQVLRQGYQIEVYKKMIGEYAGLVGDPHTGRTSRGLGGLLGKVRALGSRR